MRKHEGLTLRHVQLENALRLAHSPALAFPPATAPRPSRAEKRRKSNPERLHEAGLLRDDTHAMFAWSGKQVVFVLLMFVVCAMALVNPAWQHWYHVIVPPLLLIMMFLALSYVLRK
jgi:hypothetical protein